MKGNYQFSNGYFLTKDSLCPQHGKYELCLSKDSKGNPQINFVSLIEPCGERGTDFKEGMTWFGP